MQTGRRNTFLARKIFFNVKFCFLALLWSVALFSFTFFVLNVFKTLCSLNHNLWRTLKFWTQISTSPGSWDCLWQEDAGGTTESRQLKPGWFSAIKTWVSGQGARAPPRALLPQGRFGTLENHYTFFPVFIHIKLSETLFNVNVTWFLKYVPLLFF